MRKDRGFLVYLTEGTVSPVLAWKKKPSILSFPEALAFGTRWSYSSEHSTWFHAPNEDDLCHKVTWTYYSVFMILQMRPNDLEPICVGSSTKRWILTRLTEFLHRSCASSQAAVRTTRGCPCTLLLHSWGRETSCAQRRDVPSHLLRLMHLSIASFFLVISDKGKGRGNTFPLPFPGHGEKGPLAAVTPSVYNNHVLQS